MSDQTPDRILTQFDLAIARFRQSATKAKRISCGLRIPLLILGAVSTVILGYQMPGMDCQPSCQILVRNIALVISAAITVLVGPRELLGCGSILVTQPSEARAA